MGAVRKPCFSVLFLLAALGCRGSVDPHAPIVGQWKQVTPEDYGVEIAEFSADGSCRLPYKPLKLRSCHWSLQFDGRVRISYGLLLPINNIVGTVKRDELNLDYGDQTGSYWVRVGSQQERNTIVYFVGKAYIQLGEYKKGMADWKQAADQGHNGAANSLAWILAASKDPALRDGKLAVAYAEKAVGGLHHYQYLDTLAASLARDGQFERAVTVEQEALALLQQDKALPPADREAAEGRFRNRIVLYKARQPYTEP